MKLDEIASAARQEKIPVMMDDGLACLCQYIRMHERIRRILEAGTAVGYSAMRMAEVRPEIRIDTLEIDPAMAAQARQNIQENHLADRITVHLGDAQQYETDELYDLIFIDDAKAQYRHHLEHFMKNTYRGTVFVFDNLNFHGIVDHPELSHNRSTLQMTRKIRAFREWLLVEPRFAVEFHPEIGDGIAFARRVR